MSWLNVSRPMVILAPMDGYTDPPFRRFIKHIEPRAVVFSEFLSAALAAGKPSLAPTMFRVYDDERPVVIQLYGKDPDHFCTAARLAEEQGAAGIDINMGCPAKKVVAHRHGSALMREIDLACDIIRSVKAAVSVPVTVKTRLGWENDRNLIPFALRLQDCGLDAITIHGRTYSQKFDGEADWLPIYALKDALSIPVFGNGDLVTAEQAQAKLGNLDGVMIGRGAVSDPWLLQRVCDGFAGNVGAARRMLPFSHKVKAWKRFAQMAVATNPKSERHACQAFRKFLVRLHKDLGLSPEVRRPAVQVATLEDIERVLDLFLDASQELSSVV
ncbi:tRNA-dihydrouridine synthase [Sulfidibacter corallicola]|uniref:tRNA-dihydrouridine synthase n=1 Tax=Sulfidibacter corallicola TaxID=2818388 RepID=A0A8A4TFX7_SULCO|nr:tRNA-dihydrouridine synthase family protein [Sulfidibacter corallicola]QTD48092.1 tRNA-dihydrouridine synthase family protein [Sulfidibacter corallicola]